MKLISRFVLCLGLSATVWAQPASPEKPYYFYKGYTYGSEALFNPVSAFMNGAFDSFQFLDQNARPPTFEGVPWDHGATSVWRSITSPLPVISAFGWRKFLEQEVFPTNLDPDRTQYVPNYMLHLVGGGMVSRKLTEWYDAHAFPVPFVFGAATSMAYEFVNEIVENGKNIYPNEDCIPDILLFQTGGILLYSSDVVCEFFSSKLSLNDWSQPVSISFAPGAFRNAGQNFVMKYPLTQSKSTSIFFVFGTFGVLGLSFQSPSGDAISFGAGVASTGVKVLPLQGGVPSNTVNMGLMGGVYYDRNNSLMASVVYSDVQNNRLRVNVFPGIISSSWYSPGIYVTVMDDWAINAGIVMRVLPFGISYITAR